MSDTPPAVRILPMDRRIEWAKYGGAEDIQQKFFLDELRDRPDGHYLFREYGLEAKPGTVVLFQFDGRIIASAAISKKAERFNQPDKDGYRGALYFDRHSIKVFHPVTAAAVSRIWPDFKGFGRAKWKLDPNQYPTFERELKSVQTSGLQT